MKLKICLGTTKHLMQARRDMRVAVLLREADEKEKRAKATRRAKIKKFLLDAQ